MHCGHKRSVIAILLVFLLSACQPSGTRTTPVTENIETATAQVGGGGLVATPALATVTPYPSLTPLFFIAPDTGQPVYPLSRLRILTPGQDSRLLSPIHLDLSVILGVDNTIELELVDSSGQLLVKKILAFPQAPAGQRILISPLIDFEIPELEMDGRLIVKTYDAYDRLVALTSCDVTLLSQGEGLEKPARVPYETFLLTEPVAGQIVSGGVVTVSGYARPISTSPLILALVDENSVELSTRQLLIKADPAGAPVVFNTTLPYQVTESTPVRLIIRQSKGAIPGPAAVFSLLLSVK